MFFPTVEIVDFKATVGPPISYAVDTPIPKERTTVHPAEASKVCTRKGMGRGREREWGGGGRGGGKGKGEGEGGGGGGGGGGKGRGRGRGRGACSQPLSDAKSRVARYRHDQL